MDGIDAVVAAARAGLLAAFELRLADLDLQLVLDNCATHKTPEIHEWLLRYPRFQLHFTPTNSSLARPLRVLVRRSGHLGLFQVSYVPS